MTDKKNTPQRIAEEVVKAGMTEATIYVGENLSYENEKIWEMPVKEMMEYERDFEMNVVLVFLQD